MKLRANEKEIGFYKLFHNFSLITEKEKIIKKESYKRDINNLNLLIIKHLKMKVGKHSIRNIDISDKFNSYLKSNYKIKGYKKNEEFLNENSIITRIYNSKDSYFFIKENSFELRINKKRIQTYNDKDLTEKKLNSNFSVSIRFIKASNLDMSLIHKTEFSKMKNYAFKLIKN